jgi:hypothetical protein
MIMDVRTRVPAILGTGSDVRACVSSVFPSPVPFDIAVLSS